MFFQRSSFSFFSTTNLILECTRMSASKHYLACHNLQKGNIFQIGDYNPFRNCTDSINTTLFKLLVVRARM